MVVFVLTVTTKNNRSHTHTHTHTQPFFIELIPIVYSNIILLLLLILSLNNKYYRKQTNRNLQSNIIKTTTTTTTTVETQTFTMDNKKLHQGTNKQGTAGRSDDQSVTSAGTNNSARAAWLDERIAEQRKGYNGTTTTTTADRQAKERVKSSKSGTYREPVKKRKDATTASPAPAATTTSKPRSYRTGGQETVSPTVPRKPTRTNSKLLTTSNGLEKDVVSTVSNTSSSKAMVSPNFLRSKEYSTNTKGANNLQQTEEDVAAKARATTSPNSVMTKRSTTSAVASTKGLAQSEEDLAAKAKARYDPSSSSTNGNVASRLNQLEAKMEAKARATTGPSNMTTMKRSNRQEEDDAAKAKARGSPSSVMNKHLSKMEEEVAAKAKARGSPSDSASKIQRLNQREADLAAKSQAKAGRNTSTVVAAATMSTQTGNVASLKHDKSNQFEDDVHTKELNRPASGSRPGAVSVSQLDDRVASKTGTSTASNRATRPGAVSSTSSNLEERIAYKTGIPLSENGQPKEVQEPEKPTATGTSGDTDIKSTGAQPSSLSKNDKKEIHLVPENNRINDRNALQSLHDGPNPALDYRFGIDGFLGDDDDSDEDEDGRLAVAVAVKDYEDEDVFIPSAVEYDPDAKPPMYKNRRFRMYGLLGCTLLIMLVASVIGIMAIQQTQNLKNSGQSIPTDAPTCERCNIGIEEQLELEVGSEKLNDPSTSEFLAKEWLMRDDVMNLGPMDENLIQRFLLAAFYFETHILGDWRSCNRPPEENPEDTCSFQKIIGIFPLEFEGVPAVRWLSSEHECKWAGISCDELNQTRSIDLSGQDLQGTFPAVLTRLPYLQSIQFAWNNFSGPLPDSIGTMNHLLNFQVQYNQFTGNIPSTWSNAKNFQLMNFANNFLSGELTSAVGVLRNLKGMFLYDNMITGTLPEEFSQVSLLSKFQSLCVHYFAK